MFLLTHAAAAEAVITRTLTPFQKDQLLVGSILPDVSELKMADERQTHTQGVHFLKSIDKRYHYLGVGVVLHGSSPKGLDYYTHNGFYNIGYHYTAPTKITGSSGIIARMYGRLKPFIRRSKLNLSDGDAAHFLVEFCFDHLTAKAYPHVGNRLTRALYNSVSNQSLALFANHFQMSEKRFHRLTKVIQSRHWKKIFERFQTVEGTAHNLQHFLFIKALREREEEKKTFIQTIRSFGRSSLDLLHTKLWDRSLVRLVDECVCVLEPEYWQFMDNAVKNMKVMVEREKLV